MSRIEIEVRNLEQVRALFSTAPKRVRSELDKASRVSALLIQRNARKEAPVDMGILRSSIAFRLLPFGAEIAPGAKYALWVHEGTGRYARNGMGRKTPWFFKARDGHFVRTVGSKPNPFMERAAKLSEPGVRTAFEQAVSRITEATA